MRLLKYDANNELQFTRDLIDDEIPSYAILSHTWGRDEDEVRFKELKSKSSTVKVGFKKIQLCGDQAKKDGLGHFWIDTCCIDKSDSTELQSAIVSIQSDDEDYAARSWKPAFRKSRWFQRGWTLQELIAPEKVVFYSKEWQVLGDKSTLEQLIHEITSIPTSALRGESITRFSIAERLRWANGRKTKRKEDRAYSLLGIFSVYMPLIYGEGDNATIRLTAEIEKLQRVDARDNHLESQEVHTSLASDTLNLRARGVAESSDAKQARQGLLQSLAFQQMSSRQANIRNSYSSTCEWFFEHPAYRRWINPRSCHEQDRFLWIKGKPGAGKSTLMKFAYRSTIKAKAENDIIVSFFFNARGDDMEKSTIGMYRALLFDLLQKMPDLQYLLDTVDLASEHQSQTSLWTVSTLNELLSDVVARLGSRRLQIFVDALDECNEEQVQEMVSFFEENNLNALRSGAKFHICFASRHYPTISTDKSQTLVLENEPAHDDDLRKFIGHNLRAGTGTDADAIEAEILCKANGIFMWAVLVIHMLNEEFRRGRVFAVKTRLSQIPSKLSDLFKDMLQRDKTHMDDLLFGLQLILFTKRPLTGEEFYCAMVSNSDPSSFITLKNNQITIEDVDRFVSTSCKGLAELTKADLPTVQLIHESIRDFLLKDNGLAELWPEMTVDFDRLSHDRLKQCCETHLKLFNLSKKSLASLESDEYLNLFSEVVSETYCKEPLAEEFPLLRYASQYILYHANNAASHQGQFLGEFQSLYWLHILTLLDMRHALSVRPENSLLQYLAENNFTKLISDNRSLAGILSRGYEPHRFPLFAALSLGHRNAARELLRREGRDYSEVEDLLKRFRFDRLPPNADQSPLHWALCESDEALAEILLTWKDHIDGSTPPGHEQLSYGRDSKGRTALAWAVQRGSESLVKLLVQAGTDISVEDSQSRTPLMHAILSKSETIIELLLGENGVPLTRQSIYLDRRDADRMTILTYAVSSEITWVVEKVLQKRPDLEVADLDQRTPLHRAVLLGNVEIVRLLLGHGANVEALDIDGRSVLILAVRAGNVEVVRLILANGGKWGDWNDEWQDIFLQDIPEKDTEMLQLIIEHPYSTTGLTRAAYSGQPLHVRRFLKNGAKWDNLCNKPGSMFLDAVRTKDIEMIALLLDSGADIDIDVGDSHGNTALIRFVQSEDVKPVTLLLNKGAKLEAQNKSGNTALWCAIHKHRNLDIIRLLLEHGANVNVRGGAGFTALIRAAHWNDVQLVVLLLEYRAELEAQTDDGDTALLRAITEHDQLDVAQKLIEGGANLEARDRKRLTPLGRAVHLKAWRTAAFLYSVGAKLDGLSATGLSSIFHCR